MITLTGKRIVLALATLFCLTAVARPQDSGANSAALLAKLACPDRVKDVAFSPDGKLLAAGYGWNHQGGARIWNVADHAVVATLTVGKGDDANIERVALSPDGKLFASANWNGDVMLWTVGSWNSYKIVLANRGSSKSLTFSPDSRKMAYSSEDAALIYDLQSGKTTILATRTDKRESFISLAFSPDGKSVILFRDEALQVWDLRSRNLIRTWKPSGAGFFGNVSANGTYVIAGGGAIYGEKSVEIWNARDEKKIGELSKFRGGLFALAISHSEKLFAVAGGSYGSGGDLSVWSLTDAREIGFISFGEFPIHGLAFSPDDNVLAAASDDGFVLLYASDRIRGPQVKKQDYALCGEILTEGNKAFVVPLSKVPKAHAFEYAWKLEVANADSVAGSAGSPVALQEWDIESSAANDQVRIKQFQPLLARARAPVGNFDYVIFGDIQNPGWNEGFIAKIYSDGTFVATNNPGRCLAHGSLGELKTDFESLKQRVISEGLFGIPREPLTRNLPHYRTRFIGIASGSILELRSDGEVVDFSKPNKHPTKKEEEFGRIFEQEQSFINSLLQAGLKLHPK